MLQNHRFFRLIISLLLVVIALSGCTIEKEQTKIAFEKSMEAFSQAVSSDDLDGMNLTIYQKHFNGFVCTVVPETIEDLIERVQEETPDEIITIDANSLKDNKNLLKQLSKESFHLSEDEVIMDITWCFVFKTGNQEKLLEIAIGGWSKDNLDELSPQYIYVNGFAVRNSDAVLEILYTLYEQAYSEHSE